MGRRNPDRLSPENCGEINRWVDSLLDLSEIEVKRKSDHIRRAQAATIETLMKPIGVDHQSRLIRKLHPGGVFSVIPQATPGVIKDFPVGVRCEPKSADFGL